MHNWGYYKASLSSVPSAERVSEMINNLVTKKGLCAEGGRLRGEAQEYFADQKYFGDKAERLFEVGEIDKAHGFLVRAKKAFALGKKLNQEAASAILVTSEATLH